MAIHAIQKHVFGGQWKSDDGLNNLFGLLSSAENSYITTDRHPITKRMAVSRPKEKVQLTRYTAKQPLKWLRIVINL